MGRGRIVSVAIALVAGVIVLASGCRDATQVTLDVSLAKLAKCTETNGTAITVGTDPATTEDRVAHQYVTAATSACDQGSGEIGTLVLTPSDSGRASVIVVVAYGGGSAASCTPPLFTGCVVARRQFSFTDHRHLMMPITIDPDCKDVPCDAFSTCRTGKCFASEAPCNGDTCIEPGDPGDGGTAVDGQVIPDTGVPGDGAMSDGAMSDGAMGDGAMVTEAGMDADVPDGDGGGPVTANVYCDQSGQLECNGNACGNSQSCCGSTDGTTAVCQPTMLSCTLASAPRQYCCPGMACPNGACPLGVMQADAAIGVQIVPKLMQLPAGASPAKICP